MESLQYDNQDEDSSTPLLQEELHGNNSHAQTKTNEEFWPDPSTAVEYQREGWQKQQVQQLKSRPTEAAEGDIIMPSDIREVQDTFPGPMEDSAFVGEDPGLSVSFRNAEPYDGSSTLLRMFIICLMIILPPFSLLLVVLL